MAAVMNMQSDGHNALHPFFTRPNGYQIAVDDGDSTKLSGPNENGEESHNADDKDANAEPSKNKGSSKTRKPRQDAGKAQGQKTLAEVLNPSATPSTQTPSEGTATGENAAWSEYEDNGRRKRRRTNSCEFHGQSGARPLSQHVEASSAPSQHVITRAASPSVIVPPAVPQAAVAEQADPTVKASNPKTPPKKMMKLNAGGKLSSPGGKVKDDSKQSDTEPRRRGRPRKAKDPAPPKSLVVSFRYAKDDEPEKRKLLGERLERIMTGKERILQPTQTKKSKPSKKGKPLKPNHPFFRPAMKLESPRKASASTPGKLRRQALEDCMFDTSRELTYPVGSALLKDRLMVKHPGAKEPLWPNKEQVHVRGLSEASRPKWDWHARGKRKQKQFRQFVDSSESVLDNFTASLQPEPESVQRPDGFDEPRHDLRLPEKHLISGQDVATHVLSQLCAPLRSLDEDDLVEKPNKRARVHPSIAKLYNDIPDHLSAFDHCKGESQGWTLKHAPTTAGEVLQSNVKMTALKTWLQSLTINTVEAVPSTKPAGKSAAKPKKKRQRPVDDLDDFLVDDDVGVHEMGFLPDFAELEEPSSKHQPKSIVQTSNGSKFSNAVLLSGPHGCGKTASAYAVAKELGFQIFEISSAERRSGRDVIDKVGDMTENHIVRHHGTDAGESSASEDPTHMDAAFQKDLESGRQGKMSAFFKKQPTTKPAAKAAPAHKSQPQKTQTLETLQKALKQPVKDQQQSLILLEEVDILFKEDKDFWTTVFKLLATSKRPFIMTCNDEDLVPLGAMTLHAVLRFAPPPVDSAVDLMLLMAALEGHLLKREPVISLFEYKSRDLRASIAELDFWCQMGVGDPKGGLSWIYQRYPPGSDVDEHGRKLRVISENTFQDGMGLMQPDVKVDDDAVLLALREFGVEPTSLFDWQTTDEGHAQTGVSSLSLRDMGKLSDSLSAADTYTTHITVDASLPEMSAKARTHYTENMALLESNEKIDYSDMFEKLAVSSTLLSCRAFCPSEVAENVLSSSNLLRSIRTAASGDDQALTRRDFACFDAISVPSGGSTTSGSLELSAFDGPLPAITTDLAPYVRSIAQYDLSLEEQRRQLNDLLGEGHKPKRARTTRAARSALEGSQRGSTRRERWFPEDLDLDATLATGGKGWPKTVAEAKDVEMAESGEAPASSVGSAG